MNTQFLQWIDTWFTGLSEKSFKEIGIVPEKTAIISVDMIKGFCHVGPLASKSVAAIIPAIVTLFEQAKDIGVQHFLLIQDAHSKDAMEFQAYPPHCLAGSEEAETIEEFKSLPFANQFIVEKNSLSPAYDTVFDEWLKRHPEMDTYIIVGNCTDLCIYFMAMHLRLSAYSANIHRRIIVPAGCVATYDLPIKTAQKLHAVPHDAKTLHPLFLYHMKLNGIEVIGNLR